MKKTTKMMISQLSIAIILFFTILIIAPSTYAWVNNPSDCQIIYNSISCAPDKVCGLQDASTPHCYDTTTFTVPGTEATSNSNVDDGSYDGGFIINCTATDGAEPYCDDGGDFWCDRNSACWGTEYRDTICLTDAWNSYGCGDCRSGRYNCYGDTTCESTSTSDCDGSNNNHYIVGTCNNATGGGTCECDTNYFACDGSITDADGCEILAGSSCGSGTGTIVDDQCYDANNGNCTRISDYVDCDNDDSDNNNITCNGANGCEINPGTTTNNSNNHYTSCYNYACNTGYFDCDGGGDGSDTGNGCEVQDGGSCTAGGLPGSYDGCNGCVVDPVSYGTSGVKQNWSGTYPFLWFQQYSLTGWIFNATNFYNKTIGFTNNSCLYLNSTEYCGDADFGGGITDTNCSAMNSCDNILYTNNVTIDTNESTRVDYLYTHWINDTSTAGGDISGLFSALVVANDGHTHNCGNITGATSNLCTITDTNITDTNLSSGGNIDGNINMTTTGNITNVFKICLNDNCSAFRNSTCDVYANGAKICGV